MKSIEVKAERRKLKGLWKRGICLVTFFLILAATQVQAQTFSEWWSQKKTQKKYLIQQIAALQVYIGFLENGYNIVHSGLNTIRDITNGEFHLHDLYISSLKQVNPVIRNDKRIDEIVAMQEYIDEAFGKVTGSPVLSADHRGYINSVRDQVFAECNADMDELLLVITSGKVEMKDDERIARLNKVYLSMQDKTAFTQSFCNQVALLIRQRSDELESLKQLRRYYEY
ncbi:hypothetical protein IDJ77_22320 [Mucilaginibacter sp. ZT4R22]|uniref:TerB family tellurite resistance protein n=1 Tax=Mucilaginibacter pankratovii TaxID=2772110 RepID=A0ABR7WWA4_9SPHI|nr:hypothetical protein [Mucilaginibacter pankratovii]MBD1366566.1 hypothetical protein [Mucilaginibacter pankratovii]